MQIRDGFHLLEKRFIVIGVLWALVVGEFLPALVRTSVRPGDLLADFQPPQTAIFYIVIFVVFYFLWQRLSQRFVTIISPFAGTALYWIFLQPQKQPFPDVADPLPTIIYLLIMSAIILVTPFYLATRDEHKKQAKESIALSVVGLLIIIFSLLLL